VVPARASGGARGTTLVELLVALAVFAIAAGGLLTTLLQTRSLNRSNRELTAAVMAAQDVLEQLYAADFAEIFARFNATTADDPAAGASPGSGFAVERLVARPGDPDGLPGEIVFLAQGDELREDTLLPALGGPRDLDLDGDVDAADHAGDYRVLPVLIRVSWSGISGEQEYRLVHVLSPVSD
jgi:prepilin-type N-terminal cleavage/methylation domain-containing protein